MIVFLGFEFGPSQEGQKENIFFTKQVPWGEIAMTRNLPALTSLQILGVGKTHISMDIQDVQFDIRKKVREYFKEQVMLITLSSPSGMMLFYEAKQGMKLPEGDMGELPTLLKEEGWDDTFPSFGRLIDHMIKTECVMNSPR
ncbi:MAG: hypothetical protein HGA67_00920 [Candidatus Yonathbacteria bacterium]|nr:hypothetical protein [Candidatus Yonathbacteria bacterium]